MMKLFIVLLYLVGIYKKHCWFSMAAFSQWLFSIYLSKIMKKLLISILSSSRAVLIFIALTTQKNWTIHIESNFAKTESIWYDIRIHKRQERSH